MKRLLLLFVFSFSLMFAKEKVRIIPVERSQENENVKVYIVFPEENQLLNTSEVMMQVRVRGFPLGISSNMERDKEIYDSKTGQSLHVIVDNNPYFLRTGPSLAPYDEEGNYYEAMYRFKIPFELSQGKHILRVFPCRSFNESLKQSNCFVASVFYIQNKRSNIDQNLSDPYVTYNEPSGYIRYKYKDPILLDFYLTNCELSQDGYKVLITIDEDIKRLLVNWTPYYIYGLSKGKHSIRMQLVDKNLKQIPGAFNDTLRNFNVE